MENDADKSKEREAFEKDVASCIPGISRREFCSRLLKRAAVAGTLAVALSSTNFHDHKAIAAATGLS